MTDELTPPEPRRARRRSQHKQRDYTSKTSTDDLAGADINKIVAQYRKNGTLPRVNNQNPLFGDFTGPSDLQEQMETVQAATDRYMELPADVRNVSNNDPVRFLEMFDSPEQRVLLESAGLSIRTPEEPQETPPSSLNVGVDGDVPQSGTSSDEPSE